MIIFVDGYQNCGKSTLVSKCKYRHNRFPFNQYLDELGLSNNKEVLNGFQLAKDLGMLFGLQYTDKDVIFDRGPFSTIFYSLKELRYGEDTGHVLVRFINLLKTFKNCKFVWIKKINEEKVIERNHQDGFDYLDDDNDKKKEEFFNLMFVTAASLGINLRIFENDFSISIKQNLHRFNDFLEKLINEHN